MAKDTKQKQIKADKYKHLKKGQVYLFDSATIKDNGDGTAQVKFTEPEAGKLINITSKRREIIKDKKPTGKFETVGDIVVYEPIDNYTNWKGEKLRIHYVVISCNMFRVYEQEIN